jgi:hypothetical protein
MLPLYVAGAAGSLLAIGTGVVQSRRRLAGRESRLGVLGPQVLCGILAIELWIACAAANLGVAMLSALCALGAVPGLAHCFLDQPPRAIAEAEPGIAGLREVLAVIGQSLRTSIDDFDEARSAAHERAGDHGLRLFVAERADDTGALRAEGPVTA